ncbi:hypothetical protein AAFF_G00292450 [Aldrovandia affinis]|uniref:Uncharacterized protein n=1 Tax=Aldrovandia affinis TaxID=143900 RepID=A0AAD7SQJ5_9TELE|nr:hypothetical protein AAFF_G00292450 [Aldrovandia affinis]
MAAAWPWHEAAPKQGQSNHIPGGPERLCAQLCSTYPGQAARSARLPGTLRVHRKTLPYTQVKKIRRRSDLGLQRIPSSDIDKRCKRQGSSGVGELGARAKTNTNTSPPSSRVTHPA